MATASPDNHDPFTWELSKENVKPVRSGRDVSCISAVFQPTKVDMEQLMREKQQFEEEIIAGENLEDPIEPWNSIKRNRAAAKSSNRYLKWTIQYFPSGGSNMNLLKLLKKYIAKFQSLEQYKNDIRYVNAWTTLADICNDPLETFSYMNTEGIGTKCAEFYAAWAEEYEKYGDFKKADRIYLDGDEKCALPREHLVKKHTEFQLRVARTMEIKPDEECAKIETSENNPTSRNQERSALSGLKGKGKNRAVGTQRTGRAMQPSNNQMMMNQGIGDEGNQQQSLGKFTIFQDDSLSGMVMGEAGKWASAPSANPTKENTQEPGPWKGVRTKQRHIQSELSSSIPAPEKTNFTFYQEDQAAAPSSTRKVAANVESVLSVKKPSSIETNCFRSVVDERPVHEMGVVSAYTVDKVYSVMGEMQFEEIRAAYWRQKRKNQEEEESIRKYWEEQERAKEEERMKSEQMLHVHRMKMEEEQRKLDEEKSRLMERERKLMEAEKKWMQDRQKQMMDLEDRLRILRSLEKSCKNSEEEQQRLQEEEDVTVQLNCMKQKLRRRSLTQKNLPYEHQHLKDEESTEGRTDSVKFQMSPFSRETDTEPRSSFVIFDENEQMPLKESQSHMQACISSQQTAISANNSLNHSKRSQPSPTLNTKQALGEVCNWFKTPLPENDDVTEGAEAPSLPQEQASYFRPIKEAQQPLPDFPLSAVKKNESSSYSIYTEENNENAVKWPSSRPSVKRKGLTEIFKPLSVQPAQSTAKEIEITDTELCQLALDGDKTECFFDDVTVAGSHFAAKAQLASTPFYGRVEKLQDMTDMSGITNEMTEMDILLPSNRSLLPTCIAARKPPTYNSLFPTQESEEEILHSKDTFATEGIICPQSDSKESVFVEEPNQLSTIMEASNESEKSSVAGSKSSKSDSEIEKTNNQPTLHQDAPIPDEMETAGGDLCDFSLHEFEFNGISMGLWSKESKRDQNVSDVKDIVEQPKNKSDDIKNESFQIPNMKDEEEIDILHTTSIADVDSVCQEFDLTTIADDDTSKVSTSLTIVANPWKKELLETILSNPKLVTDGHEVVYSTTQHACIPKLFKGSNLQLGTRSLEVGQVIGQGAYAKIFEVFDVSSQEKESKEVIKVQYPPCQWEVHALVQAKSRLKEIGMESAANAILGFNAAHYYTDGSIFLMRRLLNGNILDMVNAKKGGRIKDVFIMWLACQVMRIVHSLHTVGIIHGDIKPDNFMLDSIKSAEVLSSAKDIVGLKLLDFGRAIDLKELPPGSAFTENCGTSGFSCIQMQRKQPWNYHTDLYGIAGTIHVVLFGTYMKVCEEKDGTWKIRDKIKRWYSASVWNDFFSNLLNYPTPSEERPLSISDSPLPKLIEKMENMVDANELESILPNFFNIE